MALARLTWRASDVGTFTAGAAVADVLAALKTLIDAEVAAHPSTYQWSVSDYNATDGTLELKSKDSNVADMRVLVFGGSTPDSAAVFQTAVNAAYLYACCSPTAGTTGPDNDYTTGDPYTADSTLGAGWGSEGHFVGADRVRYWETPESILVCIYDDSDAGDTKYFAAGVIAEHPSDGRVYGVIRPHPTQVLEESAWTHSGLEHHFMCDSIPFSDTNNYPGLFCMRTSKPAGCVARTVTGATETDQYDYLRDEAGNTNYFLPIHVINDSDNEYVGVLRQLTFGINATLGDTQVEGGTEKGYAFGADPNNNCEVIWMIN